MAGAAAQFLYDILRGLALAALAAAGIVALTHWAVRAGRLAPFSGWARAIRRLSDPVLVPVERQLARYGRNPQEGPLWLLAIVAVAGIVLLSLVGWVTGLVLGLGRAARGGPAATLVFALEVAFNVVMFAILVRVIGSWLGVTRYTRAMRWAYVLSDWIVEPIRRRVPPFGPLDWSPVLAYLLLFVVQLVVFSIL